MTQLQKIIKYCAMAFAIFLAVSIIGGIVSAVMGMSFAFDLLTPNEVNEQSYTATFDADAVTALEIELAAAQLRVEVGDTLQVTNNKNDITVKQNGNTIVIEEEEHLFWKESGTVTLTVPQDLVFLRAEIDTGAGKIEADVLRTAELSLSLGAGEAVFDRLEVTKDADIETGAGKLVIEGGTLGKLDLELGVGKAEIASSLGDGSRVKCGVGALELMLLDGKDMYTVHARTGVGSFMIDGKTITDNTVVGGGANTVTVEGGLGSVTVELD